MLYYYVLHIIIFLTIIIKFIVLKNPVKSSFLQQYPYPTLFSFPISGRLTLVVYVLRQGGASWIIYQQESMTEVSANERSKPRDRPMGKHHKYHRYCTASLEMWTQRNSCLHVFSLIRGGESCCRYKSLCNRWSGSRHDNGTLSMGRGGGVRLKCIKWL